jgi:hypothetical protein
MIGVKDEVGVSQVPFDRRQSYRSLALWAGIDDRKEHDNPHILNAIAAMMRRSRRGV